MSKNKNIASPVPEGTHKPDELSFNLDDRLEWNELNSGVIRVTDGIDSYVTTDIMRRIDFLIKKGAKKIQFYITSPGGSVYHSMALYDRIAYLPKQGIKTEAYVEGMAASAASMILLQAVQKRYATSSARFLLHEPRRWSFFESQRTSDMKDGTVEMVAITDSVYNILAKRCGKTKTEIAKVIDRKEVWMSSQEAKKFGLIDEVIK